MHDLICKCGHIKGAHLLYPYAYSFGVNRRSFCHACGFVGGHRNYHDFKPDNLKFLEAQYETRSA